MSITTAPTSTAAWFYLEGNSTISDASGNLLFSTDGRHVYNQNQAVMANGSGIYPINNTSSSQSALIVKQPQTQNLYYIFSLHAVGTSTNFLRYSIVDMSLAAGLGSVTVKGATLAPAFASAEKLTAVKHCNGTDVWIITRTLNTGQFLAYLLSSSGLSNAPVVSQVASDSIYYHGYLKVSPNSNKIAYTGKLAGQFSNSKDALIVHDFNNSTGIISTSSLVLDGINYIGQSYGVEFSPDASKLYLSLGVWSFSTNCIYQWDLCAGDNQAIKASRYMLDSSTTSKPGCALQIGPDGKIYQSRELANSVSVINAPNNAGAACGYSANMIPIGTPTAVMRYGLPNYVVSYFQEPHPLYDYTLHCQTAQFAAYSNTLLNSCSATNQNLQNISWNFGDPASGAANVSALQNPSHVFSALGTYTVKAVFQYQCRTDTISRVLNVIHSTPNFSVSGRVSICKGESTVLSANTNSLSYFWFYPLPGGTTASSITVNPQASTTYCVTGTYGSCSLSTSVTVMVSSCTSLNEMQDQTSEILVYPQPVDALLHIQTSETFGANEKLELKFFDLQARLLFVRTLSPVSPNYYELDLAEHKLGNGVYRLELHSKTNAKSVSKKVLINGE